MDPKRKNKRLKSSEKSGTARRRCGGRDKEVPTYLEEGLWFGFELGVVES